MTGIESSSFIDYLIYDYFFAIITAAAMALFLATFLLASEE